MLPTIISQLVVVLKDTALGFLILYPELLYQARYLGSQGQLGGRRSCRSRWSSRSSTSRCACCSRALANYLERRTQPQPQGRHAGGPAAAERCREGHRRHLSPAAHGGLPPCAARASEVLHHHRLDPLLRGQLEAQHLGVERQLGVQRPADVLRAPEAVLLARRTPGRRRGRRGCAARRRSARLWTGGTIGVLAALQHDQRAVEAVDVVDRVSGRVTVSGIRCRPAGPCSGSRTCGCRRRARRGRRRRSGRRRPRTACRRGPARRAW